MKTVDALLDELEAEASFARRKHRGHLAALLSDAAAVIRSQRVVVRPPETVHAWVLEHGPVDGPVFFHMKLPGPGWTRDLGKAVRFARRQDAEDACGHHGPHNGRVTRRTFTLASE